jgi:hypothetical protein
MLSVLSKILWLIGKRNSFIDPGITKDENELNLMVHHFLTNV